MGLLGKIRKGVKRIARPVTRVTEKVLKPIVRPLRPIAATVAPAVNPMALLVQPKVLGIRNQKSAERFDRSQRVGRIVAGTAAVVAGGVVAAPYVGAAAAKAGVATKTLLGGGISKVFSAAKGVGKGIGLDDAKAVAALAKPMFEGGGSVRAATLDNASWTNDYGDGLTAEFQRQSVREGPAGVPVWAWGVGGILLVGILFFAVRR